MIETQQARQALGDIEARHRDIINLEKSIQVLNPLNPEGNWQLIFPFAITDESNIKIMKRKRLNGFVKNTFKPVTVEADTHICRFVG